ncbi:hypothetical protein DFH09DRAFT_998004 [Mycena vulgaris]|nr:hypothetical protein DFH09DRAFT_998004 [Mycena vulgaris]
MGSAPAHALVFGASGIAGWGVVEQLLENYPAKGTFSNVTAVVNRPMRIVDSFWPTPDSPALDLVTNIDLTQGTVETLAAILKDKVENIAAVTHVYYFAFNSDDDAEVQIKTNCGMLERVIGAIESLSPNFCFLCWPSGTLGYYGGYIPGGGPFKAPYQESMGRLPSPSAPKHYYAFEDILCERSKGKSWTWCEVRPDVIVGFTPKGSKPNFASHWAMYLSLYRAVEGEGARVPFPGTEMGFNSKLNEVSSEILAKSAIWASLHPEEAGSGQFFNVADQAEPSTMRERWPALAAYFGLVGVGPPAPDADVLKPTEYVLKHRDILKEKYYKANDVLQATSMDRYGYFLDFDRQLSLDKIRAAGFGEEMDPLESWLKAFERFKRAGMVPV